MALDGWIDGWDGLGRWDGGMAWIRWIGWMDQGRDRWMGWIDRMDGLDCEAGMEGWHRIN